MDPILPESPVSSRLDRIAANEAAWRSIRAALVARGLVDGRGIHLATSRIGSCRSALNRAWGELA